MSRYLFGADMQSVAWQPRTVGVVEDVVQLGRSISGITAWDAASGGDQHLDLLDAEGDPLADGIIESDADGIITFYGPENVTALYLDGGWARQYLAAQDLAEQSWDKLTDVDDRVVSLEDAAGIRDLVDDLFDEDTFYIAHRGSRNEFPELTMDAWESVVAAGAKAIEVSVVMTADGVLVGHHDLTVNRMTESEGSVADFHYSGLRSMPIDARSWLGPAWGETSWTTLREVLDRFLGKVVIFLEPKNGTTASLNRLGEILDSYPGAVHSIVGKGYKAGLVRDWFKDRGFRYWGFVDHNTSNSEIEEISADVDYLGLPHFSAEPDNGDIASDSKIEFTVGLNVPVICWEVNRKWQRDHLVSLGVQGMMCSAWVHMHRTQPILSSDTFALRTRAPGDFPRANQTSFMPTWSNNGALIMGQQFSPTYMLGSLSFDSPPSSYEIVWEMAYDLIPSDNNSYAGIAFAKPGDHVYKISSADNMTGGYHALFRADGRLQLYRHEAETASGTQLSSTVNTAAPANGAWMAFRITVSSSQVTLQRTDTGSTTITSNHTDHRGGYIHLLRNWDVPSIGGPVRYRNIEVNAL